MFLRSAFRAQRPLLGAASSNTRPVHRLATPNSDAPPKPDIKELALNSRIRVVDEEVRIFDK